MDGRCFLSMTFRTHSIFLSQFHMLLEESTLPKTHFYETTWKSALKFWERGGGGGNPHLFILVFHF